MYRKIVLNFGKNNNVRHLSNEMLNSKDIKGWHNKESIRFDVYPFVAVKNGYQFRFDSDNYQAKMNSGNLCISLDIGKVLNLGCLEKAEFLQLTSLVEAAYDHLNVYFEFDSKSATENYDAYVERSVNNGFLFLPREANEFLEVLSQIKGIQTLSNGTLRYVSEQHESLQVYIEDFTHKVHTYKKGALPSHQGVLKIAVEFNRDLTALPDLFDKRSHFYCTKSCSSWLRHLIKKGAKAEGGKTSYLFEVLNQKMSSFTE